MKTISTPMAVPNVGNRSFLLDRRKRQAIITISLIVCDVLAISAAFWIAYQSRFNLLPYTAPYQASDYRRMILITIPAWIVIFALMQLYHPNTLFGGLQEYAQVFNAITIGMVAVIVIGFLRREDLLISRGWLAISWVFAVFLVIMLRFAFRRLVYAMRRHGHLLSATIIVGANNEGCALAEQLRDWPTSGLYILGFLDNDIPIGSNVVNGYQIIDTLDNFENAIKQHQIEELIVAPTAISREQLLNIFRIINPHPKVNLRLSTGLFEIINSGLRVKELANVPLIEFDKSRVTGAELIMKTLVDYLVALIALILLSPVFLIVALWIKIDSPGKVIYRRRVMGTNGSEFDAFKFRTMYANGDEILEAYPELREELEREYKLKDDPRVTRIGKYLRKFSIDELPQFFNVILGQMSVVGPRMISPPEMDLYGPWGLNLLTVKPGITGLWQISGRSDISYEERIRLDMYYIRNWTIWMDIYVILMTIPAVFRKKGAY